jgi:hypothetical protein
MTSLERINVNKRNFQIKLFDKIKGLTFLVSYGTSAIQSIVFNTKLIFIFLKVWKYNTGTNAIDVLVNYVDPGT